MSRHLIPEGIAGIEFTSRPDPVPYNYRITYKVAQICLILHMLVKNGGCSFVKMQMVSTALTSSYDMNQLMLFANGDLPDYSIIKFDPSVNYAIQYALVEGLMITQKDGKLKLTDRGKQYCEAIMEDTNLLLSEKKELQQLVGKVSEKEILSLVKKWSEVDVAN